MSVVKAVVVGVPGAVGSVVSITNALVAAKLVIIIGVEVVLPEASAIVPVTELIDRSFEVSPA
ncbi:MAG: hypothetical protein NT034_02470 [Candidatus Magasanikbacteria bacterium]|nr:hypothetical protein [Candidatus Magasanikbacteria bacterium]